MSCAASGSTVSVRVRRPAEPRHTVISVSPSGARLIGSFYFLFPLWLFQISPFWIWGYFFPIRGSFLLLLHHLLLGLVCLFVCLLISNSFLHLFLLALLNMFLLPPLLCFKLRCNLCGGTLAAPSPGSRRPGAA